MPENKPTPIVPLLVVLLIIAAFIIGILWTKMQYLEGGKVSSTTQTAPAPPTTQTAPATGSIRPVDDRDHIRGSKDAKIKLVEFSDLECPFCKSFHPTMQKVLKEFDGQIAWVYRHFPLDSIHPRARPAALAAECVASLGGNDKFWNYVDKLFEGAPVTLTDDQLKTIATGLGVNASQ
ncbi:thioredoxin domain-containing protein, partial [Candidatus Microgenomates bacterium]|nr:thioredoxin domain-containing protein [Candidatus Microgenomates bacterium]